MTAGFEPRQSGSIALTLTPGKPHLPTHYQEDFPRYHGAGAQKATSVQSLLRAPTDGKWAGRTAGAQLE